MKSAKIIVLNSVAIIALSCALASAPAMAQKANNSKKPPKASVQAPVAPAPIEAAAPAPQEVATVPQVSIIRAIEVKGNQRVETETILAYLALNVGQPFNSELADASLKSLFATGFFSDVQFEQNADTLILNVKENPTVNQVLFEGQHSLTTEKLEKEVQIKPRAWFTVGRVQADKKRLVEVYRRSGYFSTQITPKIIEKPQNRVDLVFEIKEGPKTGIRAINFIGNNQYSDDQLKGVVATQESKWWKFFSSRDNYDPDKMEYDREELSKHYLNSGYYDFTINSAIAELSPNQKDFLLTFSLQEGEKYHIGDVKVNAQLARLSPEALRAIVPIKTGSIYQRDAIEKSVEAITFAAGAAGYAFVDVRPREVPNREKHTVDLVFDVDEGPRVYIEKIDIIGNTATLDHVIRRELRLSEGDAFNRALIDNSKNRVKALGFFKDVNIEEKKGSLPDRTVVEVKVEEQPTGELAFSLGYSSQESYQVDVSITERNLRGRGQFFRFRVASSAYTKNVDIRFTEPRFMGRNIAAGIDIFSVQTDYLQYANFISNTTGLNLRTGFQLSEYMNLGLNYTFRKDKIEVPTSSCFNPTTGAILPNADAICASAGNYATSLLGYTFDWDRRNMPIRPTRGFDVQFSQQFAGIGTGVKYVRNELNAAAYHGFAPGWIGSAKLSAGYIAGYGGDEVRIRDRFFKGGREFRGFKIAGIGPRVVRAYRAADTSTASGYSDTVTYANGEALGGNTYYIGTLELTVPTPLPESYKIGAALFVDVGALGELDEKQKYRADEGPGVFANTRDGLALRGSAGLSVFWTSPFGPVRFDFSYPFLKESYDRPENFRFSTSTSF